MGTKVCFSCKQEKPTQEFGRNKSKRDGLQCKCNSCRKAYRDKNKLELARKQREYRANNKQARSEYDKKYREENKETLTEYYRLYKKKHRSSYNANQARRRAFKLRATPTWLLPQHYAQIKRTYKLAKLMEGVTGQSWHVDHIVPLQGSNISGLHVPWNLRVITAEENMKKGNRYNVD